MSNKDVILKLNYSNFVYASTADSGYDGDWTDRCINNVCIDVFLAGDLNSDGPDVNNDTPAISFDCALCYEDDDSDDLVIMCDEDSAELYDVATALRFIDRCSNSLLHIYSYEVNSSDFTNEDISGLIKLLPGFVHYCLNIRPDAVTMYPGLDDSCYPLGLGEYSLVRDNVYIYL